MNPSSHSEALREFLLNRMPADQVEVFEERMIRDEAFFSDLQEAEDELVDEYVLETLKAEDARLFRQRIDREPDLQDRVALRRALVRGLERRVPEVVAAAPPNMAPARWRGWNRLLIPGLAVGIIALFVISFQGMHRKGAARSTATTGAPAAPQSSGGAAATAVLFLPAQLTRGASQEQPVLHLGGAWTLKLELETPAGDSSGRWQVSIAQEDRTVFSAENLTPRQAGVVSYVVAEVPASQLPPAEYRVRLSPQAAGSAQPPNTWNLTVLP